MQVKNLLACGIVAMSLYGCRKDEASLKYLQVNESVQSRNDGSTASKTISNGLVAYYPFSGNAKDATGHGYNGVVYGATLIKDRFNKANSAYQFNGKSDAIGTTVITDNSIQVSNFNYSFQNVMTISFWANVASNNIGDFLSRRANNAIDFACSNYTAAGGRNSISVHFGSVGLAYGNKTTAFNSWHNYTYVYDGQMILLYLDGILDSQVAGSGLISNNTALLSIGKYIYYGGSTYYQYFNGVLDDIRFYNRALTASEITYLATH
jgi:Concanavalin A-like lectin/glucanases superfamily